MRSPTLPAVAISPKRTWLAAGVLAAGLLASGCGGSATTTTASTPTRSVPATGRAPQTATATATAAGSASSVSATAGEVSATLHAGTHRPKVGRPWPIRFTVTLAGAPAAASVSYEYLFGGAVVARRSHYNFRGGHFSDVFRFPSSAVGYALTFRAVITAGSATINLDYPVMVER